MENKNIQTAICLAVIIFAFLHVIMNAAFFDALSWSVSAGMGVLAFYDRWIWRIAPGEKTPKIFGIYEADCYSTFNGGHPYKSTVIIQQTLTTIKVTEYLNDGSRCESITASFVKLTPDSDWTLYYTYQTDPMPGKKDDMHIGTAKLSFNKDGNLEGRYFTDRTEQTAGSMLLKKKYV